MNKIIPTGATPLNRDAALAHESHRHEMLDPTTLRWVADLLKDLGGATTAAVAEHLTVVAETAGSAIDVRWRRGEPGPRSTPPRPGKSSSESADISRADRSDELLERSDASSSGSFRAGKADSRKRSGGSGRTITMATDEPRRVDR